MSQDEQLRKERLHLLLQQLQIPEQVVQAHFQEAMIRKLVISKEKRAWHFHIEVPVVLPVTIYELFSDRLRVTFEHIAAVSFSFHYQKNDLTESEWGEYWPLIISKLSMISSGIKELLSKQTPAFDGKRLVIQVRNETEAVALKRKLSEPFQDSLASLSLPLVNS